MKELLKLFDKCTTETKNKYGWNYECKLNLWGVSCKGKKAARDEALNYFQQYLRDGEYDSLLRVKQQGECKCYKNS